jgi:hypothetical protein
VNADPPSTLSMVFGAVRPAIREVYSALFNGPATVARRTAAWAAATGMTVQGGRGLRSSTMTWPPYVTIDGALREVLAERMEHRCD